MFISICLLAGGKYFSTPLAPVVSMSSEFGNVPAHRSPASFSTAEPDSATLQYECMKEKTDSCFTAGWKFHDQKEKLPASELAQKASLEAQSISLWRRGCLSAKHSSCDSLMYFGNSDDRSFAKEQLKTHCTSGAQGSCTVLAHWLIKDQNSRLEGEAILAHQCQHKDEDACEDLGNIQIQTADTREAGVATLNKSCEGGRITSCGLLISMYADTYPNYSDTLIAKIEKNCRITHGISACEYLAELFSGETDMRFKNIERALPLQTDLCNLGITRNCAMVEKLTPPKRQAVNL